MESSLLNLGHDSLNALGADVDDSLEGRLEGGSSNLPGVTCRSYEEAIYVRLVNELCGVLVADRAAVDDAGLAGDLSRHILVQPVADCLVHLFRLCRRCLLPGAYSPDGLVGDDDAFPVLGADALYFRFAFEFLTINSSDLREADIKSPAGLALGKLFADAEDHVESVVEGDAGLGGDDLFLLKPYGGYGVGLLEVGATLRVADKGPRDAEVLELVGGDFAGERSRGKRTDILGGEVDLLGEDLLDGEEVDVDWGNEDLQLARIKLDLVHRILHQLFSRGQRPVALPVSSDEKSAADLLGPLGAHSCGSCCHSQCFRIKMFSNWAVDLD